MFKLQMQRVRESIVPFIFIGLLIGLFIGKASWFRTFGPVRDFLKFSGINTRYPDSGQILFFNYFDAEFLTYILIFMLIFAGLWRTVTGREESRFLQYSVMETLERFGSLLAIVWLGVIVGMLLPIAIYEGFADSFKFFTTALYPLLFLVSIPLISAFLSSNALAWVQSTVDKVVPGGLGNRAAGIVILSCGLLLTAYQDSYFSIVDRVVSGLKHMVS